MSAPSSAPVARVGRAWFARWEARDWAPLVSLLLIAGFFALASESFLRPVTAMQILKQGSVLAIASAGLTFVILCGEIDLGVGMIALWTACFCGWLYERPWAAGAGGSGQAGALAVAVTLLLPLATSVLLGALSGLIVVWSRLPSFIITLATMNIAYGLARYLTRSVQHDVPRLLDTLGNRGIELSPRAMIPYSALLAAAVLAAGHYVLVHTRFGRSVYMTGANRRAAYFSGVRCGQVVVACLVISALGSGVAGLVNAGRLGSVSLDQNRDLLLQAVACVVLGGTSLLGGQGSMGRTLLGVLTFTTLDIGLNQMKIEDHARPLVLGTVLMVALVANGLLSRRGAG